MGRRGLALVAGVTLAASALLAQGQTPPQTPTFRTSTDVVTLDVSVELKGRRVSGLTSADFVVTDNGIAQEIEAASTESLPANVSLVVDTTGSAATLDALRTSLTDAAGLLRDDDRLRVLSIATETTLVAPMQPARKPLSLDSLRAGGRPFLMDGVATSLFRKRVPDRGELVVVFTPGFEFRSTMSQNRVRDIARRSEAVLHVVLIRTPSNDRRCYNAPSTCKEKELRTLSELTGGRLVKQTRGEGLPQGLKDALDDFHQSYTLRYTRRGVAGPGWHDIGVKIAKAGKYTVRARRGYIGT